MSDKRLIDVYESFAAFGSGSINNLSATSMDNARFAKFAKDCKVVDKNVSTTEVDIVFKKIKSKTERKITFEQFKEGLQLLAKVKYPSKDPHAAYTELVKLVTNAQGPSLSGKVTVPESSAVVERMTDTSLYTGLHKHRAAEGEAIKLKRANSSEKLGIVRSASKTTINSMDAFENGLRATEAKKATSQTNLAKSMSVHSSQSNLKSTISTSSNGLNVSLQKGVFDRLTDSKSYTGTHKHRFDESGNGMGLLGRDRPKNDLEFRK